MQMNSQMKRYTGGTQLEDDRKREDKSQNQAAPDTLLFSQTVKSRLNWQELEFENT